MHLVSTNRAVIVSVLNCMFIHAGDSDMLQKMNDIREMQEKLTLKHFEIDQMKVDPDSKGEGSDGSLIGLTQGLEKLGAAIQSLHSDNTLLRGHNTKPAKTVSLQPISSFIIEEDVHAR